MDLVTHLSGRKYVCSGCIHDLAKVLGWTTPEDVNTLVLTLGAVEEELATTKRHTEPAVLLAQSLLRASAAYPGCYARFVGFYTRAYWGAGR